ncbi:substrate-binding domain-containing protein [Nocardioides ferulae]|uniref:substrate-binding domain-containing protein n=1 Tax=Nocardioides ferulae TaxID=2340821 RepID=UPI0013DDA03C|nr:substrate-binding domain-containing protein [Nocardioides ferulae]
MPRSMPRALLGAVLAASLLLSACSDDGVDTAVTDDRQSTDRRPSVDEQEQIEKRYAALPARPAGVVDVDGSTRGSLTASARSRYLATGTASTVNVASNGEERAFERLCSGEIDVVDSARPISRAEWELCRDNGLDVVQFQVAAEAVVVAIKSETDVGGDCLSTEQIRDIFRAGSPVTSWAQVGLDDVPLAVGGPDPSNNAFSFFGRTVLDAPEPALTNLRSDYAAFENDQGARIFVVGTPREERLAIFYPERARRLDLAKNELVTARQVLADARAELRAALAEREKGYRDQRSPADQAKDEARVQAAYQARSEAVVALERVKDRHAEIHARWVLSRDARRIVERLRGRVAYFRFSYYELFEDQLRPFEVTVPEGETNCIFPSQRTIISGEYPLSRQLLLTSTMRSLERHEVVDFLQHYLRNAQDEALDARLVPLPDTSVSTQLAWLRGEKAPVLVAPDESDPDAQPGSTAPTEVPAR